MGNVEFSYKEISEEPPSTTESVGEIENNKIIAEFQNEVKMWEAYEKIGAVEFLGDMTEKGMANLFNEAKSTENIRYELIPEQSIEKSGVEYKVYRITENYESDSSAVQEIIQNEFEGYSAIQEKTAEQYESLVEAGKMNSLGILTYEEIAEYKAENNIPNENIKEIPCFDEEDNCVKDSQHYYEVIN